MSDISRLTLERAIQECTFRVFELPMPDADHEGFSPPQHELGLDVVSVRPSGTSSNSRTARVAVRQCDGSVKEFFFQCIQSSSDAAILAKFGSLQRLHAVNPEVVPKPHTWGKLSDENNGAKSQESRVKSQESRVKSQESREKERSEQREKEIDTAALSLWEPEPGMSKGTVATYFVVCDFVHCAPFLPSPDDLSAQLARIHQVSGTTDKFGSDVPRYHAGVYLKSAQYSRWADCFGFLIAAFLEQDIAINGKWDPYEAAFDILLRSSIPRLLLPLQEKGNIIIPTLVHGNLMATHIGIRFSNGMPVLFSPCVLYAHREYEMGASRLAIGGLDTAYVDQYLRNFPPSEPIDQVYHRVILYGIQFNLGQSIQHGGPFRQRIYNDLIALNKIYGDG